jgi:hypothetical protein
MQHPLSRTQREGLRPGHGNARHGWAQVGRIFAYEETLRVQVRALLVLTVRESTLTWHCLGCQAHEEQVGAVPSVPFCVWYSLEP